MKKTGVFYGSTTGTTESVAKLIAEKLGIVSEAIHDVSKMNADMVGAYEALILGTSTWGDGELQDDWYDGIKILKGMNLKDKVIALFGCGDSESYGDTFCDGMGILYDLYENLKNSRCRLIGAVPDTDYTYNSSVSVIDGNFVGLAIDDVNESEKTEERVSSWTDMLKADLA